MPPAIDPRILRRCPADLDEAIAFLHAEGLSIVETVYVLGQQRGLSLQEGKARVAAHPVWSEVVEGMDRTIDAYLAAFPEG